ncbi:ACBD6 family protein [Megaselia abdita]
MASNFSLSDDEDSLSSSSDTNEDLLDEEFKNAADRLQLIHSALPNDVLLELYAFYKQATTGECNIPKPNIFNSQGRAKWNSWNSLGKMSTVEAKSKYIEKLYSVDTEHQAPLKSKVNKNFSFICQSQPLNEEAPLPDHEKNSFDYVKESNLEKLESSLQKNEINELGEEGLGLIHWAADRNATNILEFLLKNKANVDLKDEDGQTALHYASSCGNLECISILLKHGADRNLIDLAGMTCFDVAFDDSVHKILRSS